MTCDQVERALDALIDGELGRWTAWCVRRHLSRCAPCSAAGDETRRISALARSWRDVAAPAALRARVAGALIAQPRPAEPPASSAERRATLLLRCLKENLTMKRSLALTVGALTVLAAFLISGRRLDPAYAELLRIESAYRTIKSVHAVGWALDPAGHRREMELWFARPYLFWDKRGNELLVSDGTSSWRYVEGERTATRQPEPRLGPESWQRLFDIEKHLERARHGFAIQDLGMEVVNGQPLRKLLLSGDGYNEREIWWLDPDTNLVRRSTLERADDPSGQHWTPFADCTRIEYDRVPPRGLFTFHPPAGVRVVSGAPGKRQYLDELLWDGRVLARRPGSGTTIELLAFRRSTRGDLFVLVRPTFFLPLNLALSDSEGGTYVSHLLDGGYREHPIASVALFPERPAPLPAGRTYQLRVYLNTGMSDRSAAPVSEPLLAVFDHLTPQAGPISLDGAVREFTEQERGVPFEFIRSAALGRAAFRGNRLDKAQRYLEDAARRLANPNETDLHAVYLDLAEVYARQGRRDAAHEMLEKAHHAATYDLKNGSTVLKAAEAMERLGDLETARRWSEEVLRWRNFSSSPTTALRAAQLSLRLGGDRMVAVLALERALREGPVLGFEDGWKLGQAFETLGRPDLALEAYTKGLETSGALKHYRRSGGKPFDADTEKLISAVRRLGGKAAVNRLTDRSAPP